MKFVVLLSAGLDSTVNFYEACEAGQVLLGLTFDYGQRAAAKEIESAKKICATRKIPHQTVALPFFKDWGKSSLTDTTLEVPTGKAVSIDDGAVSQKTAKAVWVPNRNGVFLNIGAGFAEAQGADAIVPGFNKEEAATFPDNSREFLEQATKALAFSTSNQVKVKCFTTEMTKPEIVRRAIALNVNLGLMWPCYFAKERWCGECESCQRSKRALEAAGLSWENLAKGVS